VICWPGPRSYTGQDIIEIQAPGSPPLVELLIAELLRRGARAAQPGEFTLRAFLAGKLDLPRAEAVLGVIEAGQRDELKQALAQLAGGVSRPLDALRDDLLNLLADLEAGLDFSDEDIHFVGKEAMLLRLGKGLAQLTLAQRQLDERGLAARPFRVVLAGPPNAGKSSLFNALTRGVALVSPEPGTTRDYLVGRLSGEEIDLIDTAGRELAADTIATQAQTLGQRQAEQADLVLQCSETGTEAMPMENGVEVLRVATKCDQGLAAEGWLATSALTGQGMEKLREVLIERAKQRRTSPLAPSLSRCRHHVAAALDYLRRGHELVLFDEPPELVALELRGALDQLGEMVGAVFTDDLLDRVFSRFCIGK
jgi:tRNA modification GTPase